MSETKTTTKFYGVGFWNLLTLLFVGLKLTGHISWSWWWVLAPTWIPLAIVLGLLCFIGIAMLASHILSK